MAAVGVTTAEPLEYVYVAAPVGVIVQEPPVQTAPELTLMTGVILTVIVLTLLDVHPKTFDPLTVYVVVAVGVTTALPLE